MIRFFSNQTVNRIFTFVVFLFLFLPGFAEAELSDKQIEIPDYKGTAKQLLDMISSNEKIIFAYSSEVSLDFEVNFEKKQMSLQEFLEKLLKGKSISYKIKGNKVQLFPAKTSSEPIKLTQVVRGSIVDADSKLPLAGATITIIGSDPLIATSADLNGNFRLINIPVGRINLQVSFVGYESLTLPNIEVYSGKEAVLDLNMQESAVKLDEVVVKQTRSKGKALNEMSLLSSRSIAIEETKRYTGSMEDPARVVSSFAGVAASQDGGSDIIVRGNSPKYMQWRLEGIEISSPYHMDDQNASFGALTALNNRLLATSDFYTGAFSPEYGNVLTSVMDIKLRNGNNEKFEATCGVGLMGTDVTLEGPFKKGYGGSFLINYRYSTISLIKKLGILEGVEGIVNYQDATFKAVLPTKNKGTFSIFALWGLSGFSMVNITPDGISTPGRIQNASILKDYDKGANLTNIGINHTLTINSNSFLKTTLVYSATGMDDDLYEFSKIKLYNTQNEFIGDSISSKMHTFKSQITNSNVRGSVTYNNKINSKNKIQIGTKYTLWGFNYKQNIYNFSQAAFENISNFTKTANSINNFISWKYSINENIELVTGFHNMNLLLNNSSTFEPRIAINWKINNTNSIHAGYGKHSTMEKVQNYFTKVYFPDGNFIEPNKKLGLLKADHYVIGYEKVLSENLRAKVELYYQGLYDLPVENNDTSYYATINEGRDYKYVALVNKGIAKNYGLEFTLERFFDNNYYYLFNASLYDSKYKSLEGVWRNTQYNSNYMLNFLCGKEFKNLGRKQNRIFAVNAKAFLCGGQRYIPLLRDAQGNVAVDPAHGKYFDYSKAFDKTLGLIYNVNFSMSYKINKAKSTHEIFLDLISVIKSDGKLGEYYDESKPNKIGYLKQTFFFPNIMYRVYF